MQRINYTKEEVTSAFKMFNLFAKPEVRFENVPPNGMSYDSFKKNFFLICTWSWKNHSLMKIELQRKTKKS